MKPEQRVRAKRHRAGRKLSPKELKKAQKASDEAQAALLAKLDKDVRALGPGGVTRFQSHRH